MRPIEKAEKIQSAGTLSTSAMKVPMSSGAPQGMPMQSWTITGLVDQALRLQPFGEHEVPGVEDLDLGAHAERLDLPRHRLQHGGRVGHHVVALAEIHRAAVERADLRQELGDMREPLGGARHVGAGRDRRERRLGRAEHEVAAHAGGQVQHDVDAGGADALDHLAIELRIARALAGLGVAHMDVGDGGAGLGRFDRGVGDLAGVTGTLSERATVSPAPVTAQVMKTSLFG